MSEKLPREQVEIGDVWEDRDPRMSGRRVRVESVTNENGVPTVHYRNVASGLMYRSRKDRFQYAFQLTTAGR